MCWSWEVSLFFSLLQFSVFLYAWNRNQYFDRWFVITLLPIGMQEFMQFLMWYYGLDDSTTKDNCSSFNKGLSYSIIATVFFVPVLFGYFGYKHSIHTAKSTNTVKSSETLISTYKNAFIFQCGYYIIFLLMKTGPSFIGWDEFCTFVGEKEKHQIWALASVDGLPDILEELSKIGYLICVPVVAFLIPRWIFFPIGFEALVSFVLLDFYTEKGSAASIWCWFNSILCLWLILYKYIADYVLDKNNKNIDYYKYSDNGSWWWKGTKEVLEAYNNDNKENKTD